MSVLFRPKPEISQDVVLITTAASVAVCRAIRDVLSQEPQIKWVNDVYLNGKKTAPREIIRTCCMREKAVYMPDFVMDEEGKLCEVRYDEVTKW